MVKSVKNLFQSTPMLEPSDINGVLISTNENSKYLAAEISELFGLQPNHAYSVENLCSSGSNAVFSAFSNIRAGLADVILVIGADKHDGPGKILDTDISRGRFSKPVYWASLFAAAYKRKYGANVEQIASVSAKNHLYAKNNPLALHPAEYSIDDVLGSKKITSDLRMYECSRTCTGASAVLLASESAIKRIGFKNPAWITGIGGETNSASISRIDDFSFFRSSFNAAQKATSMAGISSSDVDVAEVHDAFAICEPMALEALKIADKGQGAKFSQELYETRNRMINPRGGLIGSGHPLGATGVAQIAEIASQITGCGGSKQVKGAKIGMVHNMSAACTSSTVLVMNCDL